MTIAFPIALVIQVALALRIVWASLLIVC